MKTMERVRAVFRDVLDDEELEITEQTSQEDMEEWDSLATLNLFSALEDEFDIRFDIRGIHDLNTVARILSAIEAKLGS